MHDVLNDEIASQYLDKNVTEISDEKIIDQMIESKIALAENIIGSGEQWLTELNTDQLREVLALRNDTVDEV